MPCDTNLDRKQKARQRWKILGDVRMGLLFILPHAETESLKSVTSAWWAIMNETVIHVEYDKASPH